jgi:anaerobic selenocysteine-containing dehydrogenase
MMSHHIPQARRVLTRISKDPGKLLVVIDPRRSETAKIANIHLALRPGTDALLLKSMIAIILREGMHNQEYIDKHANGFMEILPWFAGFDVNASLKVCELEYDQVFRVCRAQRPRILSARCPAGDLRTHRCAGRELPCGRKDVLRSE